MKTLKIILALAVLIIVVYQYKKRPTASESPLSRSKASPVAILPTNEGLSAEAIERFHRLFKPETVAFPYRVAERPRGPVAPITDPVITTSFDNQLNVNVGSRYFAVTTFDLDGDHSGYFFVGPGNADVINIAILSRTTRKFTFVHPLAGNERVRNESSPLISWLVDLNNDGKGDLLLRSWKLACESEREDSCDRSADQDHFWLWNGETFVESPEFRLSADDLRRLGIPAPESARGRLAEFPDQCRLGCERMAKEGNLKPGMDLEQCIATLCE